MIASKSARCKIAIRIRAPNRGKKFVLAPVFGGAHGHDLLRQNIERRFRNVDAVEVALPDGADQRRAFEQLIARGGENAALGHRAAPVTRAPDALQGHRNRARRADLADQIDAADIDAQLERGGGHQRAQLARFEPVFGGEAQLSRQASVMRGDCIFSQPLAQVHARTRSASRRVFTKISVERCCLASSAMRS